MQFVFMDGNTFQDIQMIPPVQNCTCGAEIYPGDSVLEYDGEVFCEFECLRDLMEKRGELLHVTA